MVYTATLTAQSLDNEVLCTLTLSGLPEVFVLDNISVVVNDNKSANGYKTHVIEPIKSDVNNVKEFLLTSAHLVKGVHTSLFGKAIVHWKDSNGKRITEHIITPGISATLKSRPAPLLVSSKSICEAGDNVVKFTLLNVCHLNSDSDGFSQIKTVTALVCEVNGTGLPKKYDFKIELDKFDRYGEQYTIPNVLGETLKNGVPVEIELLAINEFGVSDILETVILTPNDVPNKIARPLVEIVNGVTNIQYSIPDDESDGRLEAFLHPVTLRTLEETNLITNETTTLFEYTTLRDLERTTFTKPYSPDRLGNTYSYVVTTSNKNGDSPSDPSNPKTVYLVPDSQAFTIQHTKDKDGKYTGKLKAILTSLSSLNGCLEYKSVPGTGRSSTGPYVGSVDMELTVTDSENNVVVPAKYVTFVQQTEVVLKGDGKKIEDIIKPTGIFEAVISTGVSMGLTCEYTLVRVGKNPNYPPDTKDNVLGYLIKSDPTTVRRTRFSALPKPVAPSASQLVEGKLLREGGDVAITLTMTQYSDAEVNALRPFEVKYAINGNDYLVRDVQHGLADINRRRSFKVSNSLNNLSAIIGNVMNFSVRGYIENDELGERIYSDESAVFPLTFFSEPAKPRDLTMSAVDGVISLEWSKLNISELNGCVEDNIRYRVVLYEDGDDTPFDTQLVLKGTTYTYNNTVKSKKLISGKTYVAFVISEYHYTENTILNILRKNYSPKSAVLSVSPGEILNLNIFPENNKFTFLYDRPENTVDESASGLSDINFRFYTVAKSSDGFDNFDKTKILLEKYSLQTSSESEAVVTKAVTNTKIKAKIDLVEDQLYNIATLVIGTSGGTSLQTTTYQYESDELNTEDPTIVQTIAGSFTPLYKKNVSLITANLEPFYANSLLIDSPEAVYTAGKSDITVTVALSRSATQMYIALSKEDGLSIDESVITEVASFDSKTGGGLTNTNSNPNYRQYADRSTGINYGEYIFKKLISGTSYSLDIRYYNEISGIRRYTAATTYSDITPTSPASKPLNLDISISPNTLYATWTEPLIRGVSSGTPLFYVAKVLDGETLVKTVITNNHFATITELVDGQLHTLNVYACYNIVKDTLINIVYGDPATHDFITGEEPEKVAFDTAAGDNSIAVTVTAPGDSYGYPIKQFEVVVADNINFINPLTPAQTAVPTLPATRFLKNTTHDFTFNRTKGHQLLNGVTYYVKVVSTSDYSTAQAHPSDIVTVMPIAKPTIDSLVKSSLSNTGSIFNTVVYINGSPINKCSVVAVGKVVNEGVEKIAVIQMSGDKLKAELSGSHGLRYKDKGSYMGHDQIASFQLDFSEVPGVVTDVMMVFSNEKHSDVLNDPNDSPAFFRDM